MKWLMAVLLLSIVAGAQEVPHEEVLLDSLHAAALGADIATTREVFATCPTCTEANPLVGKSLGRELGIVLPVTAGQMLLVHYLYRHHHATAARAINFVGIGMHSYAAVHNGGNVQ